MHIMDIAWSAGIYEGEGSCCVVSFKNKHAPRRYIRQRMTVSSTDVDVLERLKSLWGGSIRLNKPNAKTRKPLYTWAVAHEKARNFARAILPDLCGRRQAQVEFMLAA